MQTTKIKLKFLHSSVFLILFLFVNSMPVSSAFYNPYEYHTEEEETLTEFNSPDYFEDPNNIGKPDEPENIFSTLGFGTGDDIIQDDFAQGGDTDNQGAYNDVPLGDGIYIMACMVFMYAICLRIVRKQKLWS